MDMSGTMRGTTPSINYSNIDPHLHAMVKAAVDAGYVDTTVGEIHCACGYDGPPEVVVQLEEWDESDADLDMMICPSCGDA